MNEYFTKYIKYCIALLCLFIPAVLPAQHKPAGVTLSGLISDAACNPVSGASITISILKKNTVTQVDQPYLYPLPPDVMPHRPAAGVL